MIYQKPIHLIAAKRSPIGRFGGGLASLSAVEMARQVTAATLDATMISATQLTVAGHVLQAGCGMNSARQLSLAAGVVREVPAFTVNMVCGSGLKAVTEVADAIALGGISAGIAAGMECMSQAPFYSAGTRWGARYGHTALTDAVLADGLTDPTLDLPMGETAERIAESLGISRADQDAFAAESQRRVAQSDFSSEIIPLTTKKGPVARDEHPRADTTLEKLASLKPAFRKTGTVTAGNSSGINDGAAVVFLADDATTQAHGWTPLATLVGHAAVGCDPALMGLGPVGAIRALMAETAWKPSDVDSFELNEAFAAQSLGCIRQLGLTLERVNPRGGAIALGHPIGCSGARVLVTLVHHLIQSGGRRGVASLCIGGGMGIAVAVERP